MPFRSLFKCALICTFICWNIRLIFELFRRSPTHTVRNWFREPGVGAIAQTYSENISGDSKVFDRARQGETIWRNDDRVTFDVDKIVRVKVLWVDNGAVQVGKQLELVGAANVVSVAGSAVGNNSSAIIFFNLVGLERVDHAEFGCHSADPFVCFYCHEMLCEIPGQMGWYNQ